MPQIPGVPTIQPVDQPYMSPREAGRPGAAVAEIGDEAQSDALQSQQVQGRIRQAQKSVDQVAFQNQAKAAFDQYQVELKKTQNSRDVPDLVNKTRDDLNALTKQWAKSPAYMEIQQQAQSLIPEVSTHGELRSVDLMSKEWNAQIDIQKQTLLPQLAGAIRNGDTEQATYIQSYINHQYDEAQKNGLISDADRRVDMAAQQIVVRKQLNEAAITSANPGERKQAIAQLKNGGSGPLDLNGLAPGDIGALREHAIETDQTLNRLAEAGNLNAKLNIVHNAFQAPEFKNNFEAQEKALDDPQWLEQNGIVDESGKPDLVMAEKISAEAVRQEEYRKKEQVDKDEKVVEKFSPAIDENKMSRADIDALPNESQGGISNRARAQLVRQWTQNNTINRQMATMDRQEAARYQQETSDENKVADLYSRIASGELVDPLEIRTASGLTKGDKAQLLGAIQTAKVEPDFRGAITILNDSIPVIKEPKNATPEQHDLFAKQNARATEE